MKRSFCHIGKTSSILWPVNHRRADWLGHAIKDRKTLAGGEGRTRFLDPVDASLVVLPIIAHPYIARRIDDDNHLQLKPATDITAGR